LDTRLHTTGPTEVERVCAAQRGDVAAFGELVGFYQRRTVSLAFRLLGNIEDARDVSQDAFVRAFRHLGQLDDPSRFGPWLMRVVSNLSLNYRRARKLRLAAPLDDDAVGTDERAGMGGKTVEPAAEHDGILTEELRGAIGLALERLPDKQRLALILFSVEGLPQKEVAEILECSVELVKWNVFQVRQKLKEMLAGYR